MGVQKLSEFQSDLASALGRTLDATLTTRWINNAIREFAYAFKFPELMGIGSVSTVAGQSVYGLPVGFRAFSEDGIYVTNPSDRIGGMLTKETRSMYLRQYSNSSLTGGRPQAYHRYGNTLVVRPAPDSTATTLTFDYWKQITPLVGANDVSEFNDDWDDVIFRGALYRGHMNFGEHDRMINIFNMFLGLIRSRQDAEDLEEFPEGGISYIQSQFDAFRR